MHQINKWATLRFLKYIQHFLTNWTLDLLTGTFELSNMKRNEIKKDGTKGDIR